ncbi:MAG: Ig-like domain-containing protein [Terriglobales bacterium]|jgi:hypothetical protein
MAVAMVLVSLALVNVCAAQQPVLTSRYNAARWGADTSEYLLAPSNVNKSGFGHQFSIPVDYEVMAEPLYVPNVTINSGPYQGTTHNVLYIATMADTLYAVDADSGTQLWSASMLNGGVPASGSYLPCAKADGFTEEGIISTPVIDLPNNRIYLVAKTVLNGTVQHNLHVVDITSGAELPGSPVLISAVSESKKGRTYNFNSLHQKNRPGLLLLNGALYMGFGSNGCNDANTGWVLAYDAGPSDSGYLSQLGAFNTAPDVGFTSIWQTGNGLAADEAGNLFVATAESTVYDVNNGGQTYANSVIKLTPDFPWNAPSPSQGYLTPNEPADYFSPWDVTYLDEHDLDVSSVGALILPDQDPGPAGCSQSPCHEVLASGKQGIIYVMDRDNLGQFSGTGQDNILQEYSLINHGELMCSPAYWNGTVYYTPGGSPIQALQVANGVLTPIAQTSKRYIGARPPAISANGTTNGILWDLSGYVLDAFDAVSMSLLYGSNQSGARDALPPLPHFASLTIANGRVYVPTQSSVEVYGLFRILTIVSGNNQSAQVLNPIPAPLQIEAEDPYNGQPVPNVSVAFSDGNKGGKFSNPSGVTDSNGMVSTTYTFPKKSGPYTITISAANFGSITATETATPAAAQKLISYEGARQIGPVGTVLPNPLVAEALDAYSNPVPGVNVSFTSNNGGVLNPTATPTNAKGQAATSFQLPTSVVKVTVTASAPGIKSATFVENSVAGPAASANVNGGNNQSADAGDTLPQALTVLVTDQYGNPVSGVAVTYNDGGANGTFGNPNPATTGGNGIASVTYTLPQVAGMVTITATAAGVTNPAVFTETAQ